MKVVYRILSFVFPFIYLVKNHFFLSVCSGYYFIYYTKFIPFWLVSNNKKNVYLCRAWCRELQMMLKYSCLQQRPLRSLGVFIQKPYSVPVGMVARKIQSTKVNKLNKSDEMAIMACSDTFFFFFPDIDIYADMLHVIDRNI